jgi:hypothetical protein
MATLKQGGVIKAEMRIEVVKPSRAEPLVVV